MPWPVNLTHFDGCVNSGLRQAAKFLQRAVDAEDEGRIGPLTLRAREESLRRGRPARQQMFLKGWLNRVKQLETALKTA